ncbi:hypothetical protein CAOG_00757 [Capsaspora owczarzaki ATCC 30864]|uniref:GRAM domain-containing protein n=1 Tax=Capsaspora owczarzaki (strain ATCC 30864) TaxID=595528 RepID=A0A0D2VH41_CAPO3|nr:hypothetical protein CAOG_00757 [Capsaspora owczarzaki ATCC 30864]KJE89247.1 hypothetical protein CAOG_000757 [Capsaspora owczarzaki ATCC 30864]|eukprot:XP_004365628.1 hypothetical protein CAOG_00757 [Capsaspora owczarzaki ATCC 30864]
MALNAAFLQNGGIVTLPGEQFAFDRGGIEFSVTGSPGGSSQGAPAGSNTTVGYNGKGHIFLSNFRIVFLNQPVVHNFESFVLPLPHIYDATLKQPIFGANFFAGFVNPLPEGGLSGKVEFKIYFKEGGATDFATRFLAVARTTTRERAPGPGGPPSYYAAASLHGGGIGPGLRAAGAPVGAAGMGMGLGPGIGLGMRMGMNTRPVQATSRPPPSSSSSSQSGVHQPAGGPSAPPPTPNQKAVEAGVPQYQTEQQRVYGAHPHPYQSQPQPYQPYPPYPASYPQQQHPQQPPLPYPAQHLPYPTTNQQPQQQPVPPAPAHAAPTPSAASQIRPDDLPPPYQA